MTGPSNVYYNIKGYKPITGSTGPERIEYSSTRVNEILEKPSDYELAIVRFNLPANLPLFLYPEDADAYRITLKWKTFEVTKQLIYTEACTGCFYPRGIYNIHTVYDIINTALETAAAELKVLDGSFPYTAGEDIFYYFDPETQLTSLYVPQAFGISSDFALENSIQLYETFFGGLESVGDFTDPSYPKVKITVEDRKLNKPTIDGSSYFQLISNFPTSVNQASTFLFETDSIPVSAELEPGQNNEVRRIVTDFNITGDNDKSGWNFFPQGPLRWYDLESSYPLKSIDLRVFIQFIDGQIFPVYLARGQGYSVKIQFRKKESTLLREDVN